MNVYSSQIRFTPVGELLRLVILRRLTRDPATTEEINELAKKVIEALGIKYDWRVWPKLLEGEVEFRGGVVSITPRGKWVLEMTDEEVTQYVKKKLGVEV